MAKQLVDTTTNNGTHIGDPAKTAFEKVNANFNELYPAALPASEAERAAARGRLGLGTAATMPANDSDSRPVYGTLLRAGDGGIGSMLDLRNNQYPLNLPPSLIHGVGTITGFADGGGFSVGGMNVPGYSDSYPYYGIGTIHSHWSDASAGGAHQREFRDGDRHLWMVAQANGEWGPWREYFHTGNASALPITGSLSPSTDNAVSYGTAARRPTQLFAATATIGTSDAREKTPVRDLTEAEYAIGLQLAREIGAYRWLEAVERKGNAAREHFGQTVQRAIEIFRDHGLDPFAYGAICYDSWEQETVEHPAQYEQIEIPAVLDEQGNEIEPVRYEQGALIREAWTEVTLEAGDRYSWRDSELFWLICAAQQRQADELDRQQADILARLEALEQGA